MRNPESAAVRGWSRKLAVAVLIAGLGLSTTACSKKKSDADLASEALTKGLAAHKAGNLAEAAADYHRVLVYDPNNKFAYYDLGLIDQTNGSLASADSNYSLAISIDPKYVPALYNLAIVKTAEGDLNGAVDLYRSAIDVQRSYAAAHLNLGFALIQNGDKREGKAELKRAVALDPSLADRIPSDNPTAQNGQQGAVPTSSKTPTPQSS
ncbi:MAG: tetratricopeptide repeat protein [Actinomycetota bacterium]|nr:tetratricopeptide repeat protein [Actinomycetota bacterium]